MAWNDTAASRTVFAIGPMWSMVHPSGITPRLLIRPKVGFRPVTPQKDAGMRIDPPVSVPVAKGRMPAATAAPEPPLDPPGMRSVSHGFRTAPKCGLLDVMP